MIVISTEKRKQRVQEAISSGASGYVKKPFRPEEIKNILTGVIGEEYARKDDEAIEECDF
ncbi:MAG: hypothetical protein KIIPBIDF_01930 [Candidatus Methanoperedenaceae archaeon GB50]|nr:MAG: hypothetical protein KIIPBIDF_01930 [Candidatus Methanoperedenaceae archaeon GB50]